MILFILILGFPCLLGAQDKDLFVNLQLHRDFHRQIFTSTVELFALDRYGSTFFFTDFDFDSAGQTGAYAEVARSFRVYRLPCATLNATLQFNDGVLATDGLSGKGIPRTVLGGVALSDLKLGTAWLEVQGLARQEFGVDLGWQLTVVWSLSLPKTPFEFLGYLDWNTNHTGANPPSVQAEPQVVARFHSWAVGTELEISRNFPGAFTRRRGFEYRKWYTHPTVFLRLDF